MTHIELRVLLGLGLESLAAVAGEPAGSSVKSSAGDEGSHVGRSVVKGVERRCRGQLMMGIWRKSNSSYDFGELEDVVSYPRFICSPRSLARIFGVGRIVQSEALSRLFSISICMCPIRRLKS
jgi:hypothetical protein